jgi:tight adherence protein B
MDLSSALAIVGRIGSPEGIAVAAGLAVLVVLVGLYVSVVPDSVHRRLVLFVASQLRARGPTSEDLRRGPPELVAALDRQLARRRASATTRVQLIRAGLDISVAEYLIARIVSAGVVGIIAWVGLYPQLGNDTTILALLAALIGFFLPVIFVGIRRGRRVGAIEAQFPDALTMLSSSLQAGSSLGQGIELIGRDMTPPISEEFQRVLQEVRLGLSLNEALQNMTDRIGSEDVDLAVTSISVQTRIGGNLVEMLGIITSTIRERIRIKGEIRVLTSQQRMSSYLIGVLPPGVAVILYLMNPVYISRLFDPGLGRCMLIGAVVMMVAGIISLNKITQIEV